MDCLEGGKGARRHSRMKYTSVCFFYFSSNRCKVYVSPLIVESVIDNSVFAAFLVAVLLCMLMCRV